ncbi:DUF2264 domain-containing protein [Mangrovimonas sp. DI 80]|uniref:DUF2264 domain-containing protein n=1 Tax=Mangrovimonas sp. DI 80 TaxID=1779330 RepID=UPI000976D51E|nr:DUF2264 domain-containing protein [Mangrovimonas sp. DI 80]OMP30165.1 hypothetical protein BKM32_12320 [Mangrovimonas sp. DI 80]
MRIIFTLIALFLTANFTRLNAQSNQKEAAIFQIDQPDYKQSPYTGMTKQHWRDAALYILEGAFSYINSYEDPMKFPKLPGKSYPHNEDQVPTEKLEGLCRTLFVAAPLLKENPSLQVNGIDVAKYYRLQILNLLDPAKVSYIPPRTQDQGPTQILVEFGALAISLFVAPEAIWEPLSQEQKNALAHTMLSYGNGPTVPSNWRFFNIFVMSFFKDQGYAINEELLNEYLNLSLDQYRADGWYNDAPAYDYYSMWAFQLYGILWSEFYGQKYLPEIAAKFTSNFTDMTDNYPYLFSENGEMIMYGRSISYRFASISPLPFFGTLEKEDINYGWMRRISSGVLMQFLSNPEFLEDEVPTLGFYGHFEPAVQNYSCRGSVYWMGKAFLGLLIPDNNPFWTAIENNGPWKTDFKKDTVYNKFQEKSNTLITDYPNIGASEIRAWCHEKVADDWQKFRSSENYNKLSYNSAFPWQADGQNGEVSMNYAIKNKKNEWEVFRLYDFKKFEDGIYYRDAVLETDETVTMQLADIPLPNGILRIDLNTTSKPLEMHLGHYALPKLEQDIKYSRKRIDDHEVFIMDNGAYQLAMVILSGWDNLEFVETTGLHPVSRESCVLNAISQYTPKEDIVFATLMLWKASGDSWSKEDLVPVKSLKLKNDKVIIKMKDGNTKTCKFLVYP